VRDDDLRALLRSWNPWWMAAGSGEDPTKWTATDPVLRSRTPFDQGYRSQVLSDIADDPLSGSLYVLRGPRRVGKSVAVKDLAAAMCRRADMSPWQLIYFPADEMADRDLRRAVALGRDLTRAAQDRPRVWLIDEITSVTGWTAMIKSLRDNTPLSADTLVLTGSSASSAAEGERDLGAGRVGTANPNPFRLLLPMSFAEFVDTTEPDLRRPSSVDPWDLQSPEVEQIATVYEPYADQLDLTWQRYLESGGFPRAVAEYSRAGQVSATFCRDLASWLRSNVDPEGPQESVPVLLDIVHQRTSSPLNLRAISSALGTTRVYVDRRLNRLVSAFGAVWCPQRDDRGYRVAGSQSKLYLLDPLLAHVAVALRPGLARRDFAFLTEAAIGISIARAIERTSPGRLVDGDTIGYARTQAGGEVDFAPVPVAGPRGTHQITPVEAKWVTDGWRAEARVIEAKYGRGVVATKNITSTTTPAWALPAPLLALILG
jgi:uncharacterized protein